MKGRIIILIFILIVSANCKTKDSSEMLYRNLPISDFYVEEKCFTCNYESYNFYFDLNGWLVIENAGLNVGKAQFEFYKKGEAQKMRILDATNKLMIGEYNIKIDTLLEGQQFTEIAISFKSQKVFFKGHKSMASL